MSRTVEYEKLFNEHLLLLAGDQEVPPPWIVFPASSPAFGWNQGYPEYWKTHIWIFFWNKMDALPKNEFITKWKPTTEWNETLNIYWG